VKDLCQKVTRLSALGPTCGFLARELTRFICEYGFTDMLDDRTVSELRDLWTHHPVLVFRRQALSENELTDFSALFGPLKRVIRTDWASPVRPEVGVISNLKYEFASMSV
jgi:alpha-ketoglutarate-dependent taurine dioxygenase